MEVEVEVEVEGEGEGEREREIGRGGEGEGDRERERGERDLQEISPGVCVQLSFIERHHCCRLCNFSLVEWTSHAYTAVLFLLGHAPN